MLGKVVIGAILNNEMLDLLRHSDIVVSAKERKEFDAAAKVYIKMLELLTENDEILF